MTSSRRSKPITSCIEMGRVKNEKDLEATGQEILAECLDKRRTFSPDSGAKHSEPGLASRALKSLAEFFSILLGGPRPSVE